MFFADFLPRVRNGLEVLGLPVSWVPDEPVWDSGIDAADVLFNGLLPGGVARLKSLDPVTTEVVRLRGGAVAHNCRLCKSLREGNASTPAAASRCTTTSSTTSPPSCFPTRTRRRCAMPTR